MLGGIWGLLSSLPELIKFAKFAYGLFLEYERSAARAALSSAIDKMIETKNQIGLEEEIGSGNAGKPTQHQEGVKTRPVHKEPAP